MASNKLSREKILTSFYDDGVYTSLFSGAAVCAAFGSVNGQTAYALCQSGEALTVKDVEKSVRVLRMAAKTGNPVVSFYDSVGAKLEEGLDVLAASAKMTHMQGRLSGVVPQIAVVLGVCGSTAALCAAQADVCVMAKDAELFFTPPFTSAAKGDKLADAGTAAFAAQAGVAAVVAKDAAQAVSTAAHLVGLLPANNLASPAVFESAAPGKAFPAQYKAQEAVQALADADSAVELYADFGKKVVTALCTVNGCVAGIVATEKDGLCHQCVSKAARFVRLCDAFSIPVVTVVSSEGFVPSSSEDLAGGIREASRLAGTYADATTAKVAVVAGKAVGPVYTALANADLVVAMQGCTIAAVEPRAAVSVLFKEELDASDNIVRATEAKAAQYAAQECSAEAALAAGLADFVADAATVRGTVVAALDMLSTKRTQRMPKKHGNMAL